MRYLTLLLFFFCVSCLSPLDQARRDYTQALTEQHTALIAFQSWDRAHQFILIHQAASKSQAKEKLTTYRKKRLELQTQIATWLKQEDESVDVLLSLDQETAAVEKAKQEKAQVATLKQAITIFEQQQEKETSR